MKSLRLFKQIWTQRPHEITHSNHLDQWVMDVYFYCQWLDQLNHNTTCYFQQLCQDHRLSAILKPLWESQDQQKKYENHANFNHLKDLYFDDFYYFIRLSSKFEQHQKHQQQQWYSWSYITQIFLPALMAYQCLKTLVTSLCWLYTYIKLVYIGINPSNLIHQKKSQPIAIDTLINEILVEYYQSSKDDDSAGYTKTPTFHPR